MNISVEKRLELLEQRITFLEDTSRIQQVMVLYHTYETTGEGRRIIDELWTHEKSDPTHEYGAGGVYRGIDEISPFYCREKTAGVWQFHPFNTPSITIQPDGCTARGAWTSLGVELDSGEYADEDLSDQPNRVRLLSAIGSDSKRYQAEWVIQAYHVIFTKEKDVWRIWHMHISEPARCPFHMDWVQFARSRFETDGIRLDELYKTYKACVPGKKPENIAAEPTTWHWQYTQDGMPCFPDSFNITREEK